jgi:hypothetical protein
MLNSLEQGSNYYHFNFAWTGSNVPADITSTGNQLYVTFSSAGEAPYLKLKDII